MSDIKLSVLDLTPVSAGSNAAQSLKNSVDLVRLADELGYTRYWLSEHHNSSMLASAVPEIMIGHLAQVSKRIRVGAGGIMLPNHAPLKVAEQFKLLEALHPDRIDLGLGRAPGTDGMTALALRRTKSPDALMADDFPEQLTELSDFLAEKPAYLQAIPLGVKGPPIWLLGSSGYSVKLAAERGLAFGFAHHIQPEPAIAALNLYHDHFQPSEHLAQPQGLLAVSAICAETDEAADELAMSSDLTWLRFRTQGGQAGPIPSVAEAKEYPFSLQEREFVRISRQRVFVGSPQSLREQLTEIAEQAGVKEIMVTSLIHAHQDRLQSYKLLAQAFNLIA